MGKSIILPLLVAFGIYVMSGAGSAKAASDYRAAVRKAT